MNGNDERHAGTDKIVGRTEQNGEMPMQAAPAIGGYGSCIGEQLALEQLQCGVRGLAFDGSECFVRKRELGRGHGDNRGRGQHG